MLLGEVKAEALKLVVTSTQMNISYLDIDGLKNNPTYAGYLYAMNGSINRALDRFWVVGVIPEEIPAITAETSEITDLKDLGVKDVLARMIPLYIVGDIVANEMPNIAQDKRNEFEHSLEEYLSSKPFQQEKVETIYSVEGL